MSRLCCCLPVVLLACATSWAQRTIRPERIAPHKQAALVIGNGAYTKAGRLKNPVNDAQAMARRLGELNFEVELLTDASRKQMGQKLDQFADRLGPGDVALFYYSGHGVQVDGENYLIPVDFEGDNESDVRYDSFAAGKVQERMERSGAVLNILILDACRNNPFSFGKRALTKGLAPITAGRGTFVAFATAPGSVADDNPSASNGLFTQYLLQVLLPDLGLDDVFNLVRARVDATSGGKQLPWTYSSVVGQYVFQSREPTPAAKLFTEGTKAFQASDNQTAIAKVTEALKLREDWADAYELRARAYGRVSNWDAAFADIDRAVRLSPVSPQAVYFRGQIFERRGELKSAAADYERACALSPDWPQACQMKAFGQGAAAYNSKDYQTALTKLSEALRLRGDWPEAYNLRAAAYDGLSRFDEAFADYSSAIRLSPNWSSPMFYRGRIFERRGDSKSAFADYDRACTLTPGWAAPCAGRDRLRPK